VRSAYTALRVLTSSAVKPIKTGQLHIPVARRNESCEGRANEAPAKAAGSRLDEAAKSDHTWVPKPALLTECFAGACLKCRKIYQNGATAHTRSAA